MGLFCALTDFPADNPTTNPSSQISTTRAQHKHRHRRHKQRPNLRTTDTRPNKTQQCLSAQSTAAAPFDRMCVCYCTYTLEDGGCAFRFARCCGASAVGPIERDCYWLLIIVRWVCLCFVRGVDVCVCWGCSRLCVCVCVCWGCIWYCIENTLYARLHSVAK